MSTGAAIRTENVTRDPAAFAPRSGADAVVLRRPGEDRDVFRIIFDPVANLIRAYASGTWSFEETNRYIGGLTHFVHRHRSNCGSARVLLDRRDIAVQSPTVAELLAKANGLIFRDDDKIALVVSSSLAKASLRQRMPHSGTKAFLSPDAAEAWLRAFDRSIDARPYSPSAPPKKPDSADGQAGVQDTLRF